MRFRGLSCQPGSVALLLCLTGLAHAEGGIRFGGEEDCPPGAVDCGLTDFVLRGVGCPDLAGFSLDSGWLPEGNEEIQVRFRAQIGGLIDEQRNAARVSMTGQARGHWPEPITVGVIGCEGGGEIEVAYGVDISVQIRYDVEYEGVGIDGVVDIPVPLLDDLNDFRVRAQRDFDPFALENGVDVRGESEPVTVFEYDVLGSFFDLVIELPLGGEVEVPIEGGFRLDLVGYAEADYRTTEIRIDGQEGTQRQVDPPDPKGYGARFRSTIEADGEISCEIGLSFLPTLFLDIAGFEFEYVIPVDLDVRLDRDRSDIDFPEVALEIDLPDVQVSPEVLDLGQVREGGVASGAVTVFNLGEAPLRVWAMPVGAGVSAGPGALRVAPGMSADIQVELDARAFDDPEAALLVTTNDPDTPAVSVGLLGEVVAVPDGGLRPPVRGEDAGLDDAGRFSGSAPGPSGEGEGEGEAEAEGEGGGASGDGGFEQDGRLTGGCSGCSAAGGGGAWWLLLLLGLRRRRE